MLVCIIASHLTPTTRWNRARIDLLEECILSTLNELQPDKILLCVSGSYPFIIHEKITIIYSQEKKSQFQNIEAALPYIDDEDLIVLMDDDDLFLPDAKEIIENNIKAGFNKAAGLQYTCKFDEVNFSYNDVKEKGYIVNENRRSSIGSDFPGTYCSGIVLKDYFKPENRALAWGNKLEDYTLMEEDCVFLDYAIDNNLDVNNQPWIWHRI